MDVQSQIQDDAETVIEVKNETENPQITEDCQQEELDAIKVKFLTSIDPNKEYCFECISIRSSKTGWIATLLQPAITVDLEIDGQAVPSIIYSDIEWNSGSAQVNLQNEKESVVPIEIVDVFLIQLN